MARQRRRQQEEQGPAFRWTSLELLMGLCLGSFLTLILAPFAFFIFWIAVFGLAFCVARIFNKTRFARARELARRRAEEEERERRILAARAAAAREQAVQAASRKRRRRRGTLNPNPQLPGGTPEVQNSAEGTAGV